MARTLLLSLITGTAIAVAGYFALTPTLTDQQNARTALQTVAHAGTVPGSPLWAPPTGHTTQDLSGVPAFNVYPSAENGGGR